MGVDIDSTPIIILLIYYSHKNNTEKGVVLCIIDFICQKQIKNS